MIECSNCRAVLPPTEFYAQGLQCKPCKRAYANERRRARGIPARVSGDILRAKTCALCISPIPVTLSRAKYERAKFCSLLCAAKSQWPGVSERFNARCVPMPSGCIEWQGPRIKFGYGQISYDGRVMGAHRVAWILAGRDLPDDLCVLHKCDNPPCVNPDHLFLGTKADNNADRLAKGRYSREFFAKSPHRAKKPRAA